MAELFDLREIEERVVLAAVSTQEGPSGNRAFQTGAGMTHTSYACP